MRPRSLIFSLVFLLAAGGLVPLLANSVSVSSGSLVFPNGRPNPPGISSYCQQSGTSSASCESSSTSFNGLYDAGGFVSATAAFGNLSGNTQDTRATSIFSTSFSDNVIVTGGTGSGTLVSHYYLVNSGEAFGGGGAQYVFVQGATKTGVMGSPIQYGLNPVAHPLPGCEVVGFCFSESFDVASPMQFGTALPLGALLSSGTPGGESLEPSANSGVTSYSSLNLTGYTVLDASGNLVGGAAVTRENLPLSYNLDFTPEPLSGGLALLGFGTLLLAGCFARGKKVFSGRDR